MNLGWTNWGGWALEEWFWGDLLAYFSFYFSSNFSSLFASIILLSSLFSIIDVWLQNMSTMKELIQIMNFLSRMNIMIFN